MSIDQHHALTTQIRRNCDVSDARHAGVFSICGLALRLRDLYKWENRLDPWVERDSAQIIDWIDARERHWEAISAEGYGELTVKGKRCEPFDTRRVNAALNPENLFYGAIYARHLKPMFFLATIEERQSIDGIPVFILGRELARDLMTVPALHQDGAVIVRSEAARMHLWDQIAYIKSSGRRPLAFALRQLGLPDASLRTVRDYLPQIMTAQTATYVHHEVAEIRESNFGRRSWRRIIAAAPQSVVELAARASKDLLADTGPHGPLRLIIRQRDAVALALYTAFLDGLLRELFPEIRRAFEAFSATGSWEVVAAAVDQGHASGLRWAETLKTAHAQAVRRADPQWAISEIERRLQKLRPSHAVPPASSPPSA